MEIWGGIECTLNRVGSRFFDQFVRSGHLHRPEDLDCVSELGIRTLRYPAHWERVQPRSADDYDWTWIDARMERLAKLGIQPILGLLHHGSGPAWTNLLAPEFPAKLAVYARAVAERYPQVRDFTPVNEPLTTARFSALYGHWYPHRRDDRSFVQALLNQIEGVIRAMQAIRTLRPDARLVQTEDIARTHSTPRLAYQAEFENHRRWLSLDLLTGRFREGHPLWNFILGTGVARHQLDYIAAHPCVPDIYGVNYYVTSERYLDENLDLYPSDSHGGNGRDGYADIAAVGAPLHSIGGMEGTIREVGDRYGGPLAVTEAHLGCTREEQVRWLMEAWNAGTQLRAQGVDIRAITVWALLGAFDWNTLATCEDGLYEPGAFDLRGNRSRPTAVARAVTALAKHQKFDHPILQAPGWWRRPERRIGSAPARGRSLSQGQPVLIFGGAGNLGRGLDYICGQRGLPARPLSRYEADVCDPASIRHALEKYRPWSVINVAGYTLIDEAENDRAKCFEVNVQGALNAARACAAAGLPYATISSDLVFDGRKETSYTESDSTGPLGVFGQSKEEAERRILAAYPGALVVRTASLFDPWHLGHFAAQVLVRMNGPLLVPPGRISPTYTVDLCHRLLDLLVDEETGIWHLANVGAISWRGFATLLWDAFGLSAREVSEDFLGARRPAQSVLTSERDVVMPTLENAMNRFCKDFQPLLRRHTERWHERNGVLAT